ncbi:MAG: hypothetical protein QG660_1792, partial [Pseudomonadota bacterium]|nr:hypothetical protein [Pseudomonadota bacterium]
MGTPERRRLVGKKAENSITPDRDSGQHGIRRR